MQIRAAIQWEAAQPLVVQDAELAPPGPGEVLVEVRRGRVPQRSACDQRRLADAGAALRRT